MPYSATPRTEETALVRYHSRPTLVGTVPAIESPGPYSAVTVTAGKGPIRPDLRSYPTFVGQGPEATITTA